MFIYLSIDRSIELKATNTFSMKQYNIILSKYNHWALANYCNCVCANEIFVFVYQYLIFSNDFLDEPKIVIVVVKAAISGECTRLIADVKPADLSGWSLKWLRIKNFITEEIDTNREKFRGSNDRQLVIHSMCEDDKGKYQAVLTSDSCGKYKIISGTVCLRITKSK